MHHYLLSGGSLDLVRLVHVDRLSCKEFLNDSVISIAIMMISGSGRFGGCVLTCFQAVGQNTDDAPLYRLPGDTTTTTTCSAGVSGDRNCMHTAS